jgi:hypothetical protein
VQVSGGGTSGLVLDETRGRLYVTTRFDNGISVVDTTTRTETDHYTMHSPEPQAVINGRSLLYDADYTSSNGEASCSSCHVNADKDELAWDLGDPVGSVLNNPNPFTLGPVGDPDFHPMKGPMTTQSLRGMANHGPMHWRGDRTGGNDPGGSSLDEDAAFKKFNPAFVELLGRETQLTSAEMQSFTDFILNVTPPPNPIRNLDDSLTPLQEAGRTFYLNNNVDTNTCNGCHALDPANGLFGASGASSFEGEPQHFKIAQLRNMYEKVGMFGMPAVPFFNNGDNGHKGDQIRGFGFIHDGSVDTLFRFLRAVVFFGFQNDTQRRNVEQFMFAFDSDLKPIVGQQITLTGSNSTSVDPRINLLTSQANAGNCDLVIQGSIAGEARSWWRSANDTNQSDRAIETPLTDAQLHALVQAGDHLSYTAAPPGSGIRIGIDRDEDGILNGDDNCPANRDPDQTDTDGDGQGAPCDTDDDNDGLTDVFEGIIGSDPLLTDTDNDGLSDYDEVANDGLPGDYNPYDPIENPTGTDTKVDSPDTDGDGLLDGADPVPLIMNVADGDIAPATGPDGIVNTADYLLAVRFALGLDHPSDLQLAHGDVYSAGAPDGKINLQDLIQITRLVFMP